MDDLRSSKTEYTKAKARCRKGADTPMIIHLDAEAMQNAACAASSASLMSPQVAGIL
jgi:hypothetical protein